MALSPRNSPRLHAPREALVERPEAHRLISSPRGHVSIARAVPLHCPLPTVSVDRLPGMVGSWGAGALLESGAGFGEAGRTSIYTARPRLVFEATGDAWNVSGGPVAQSGRGDVLAALA